MEMLRRFELHFYKGNARDPKSSDLRVVHWLTSKIAIGNIVMISHVHQITKIAFLLSIVACFALSISGPSFGALTDFSWVSAADNPEGAAATVQVWLTGGEQDFVQDPEFGPIFSLSPSGNWGFRSFVVNETLAEPPEVRVDGVLSRVDAPVPGPGEIPFGFAFNTDTPEIFDGPVFFPITDLPEGVDSLTFAVQMGTDQDGNIYGIGMGVGLVPEPSTLTLAGLGLMGMLACRRK